MVLSSPRSQKWLPRIRSRRGRMKTITGKTMNKRSKRRKNWRRPRKSSRKRRPERSGSKRPSCCPAVSYSFPVERCNVPKPASQIRVPAPPRQRPLSQMLSLENFFFLRLLFRHFGLEIIILALTYAMQYYFLESQKDWGTGTSEDTTRCTTGRSVTLR